MSSETEWLPPGEPVPGQTYRADGWIYRDLPNMLPDLLDQFVAIIGDENIVWLTKAERTWPDGQMTRRGQILISPQGMGCLREHAKATT